ncbi:MAG TPA: 8-oxo-dGTP diphosphatase [Ktedonobacteraceae bacterium]|nr:8-oxo-dGTP diphosphatase [Ktedonobacteraceae bacterium]
MSKMQAIIATLGYVLSPDRSQVLLIHRNKRPDDLHFGKYNGLGGKVMQNEDVLTGMRREITEESGLVADHLNLRGTISWPGFGKQGEDWFGFIFLIDKWHGEVHSGNHEGTLEWVAVDSMLTLPLWPSDKHFLPMVFDSDPHLFYGCMPFHKGEMVSWSYERM